MSNLEELLPEFRKGAKIRQKHWEDGQYIFVHANGSIYLATGRLFRFDTDCLLSDGWERYQEPIDWDYIIKNKCLCWFLDNEGNIPQSANCLKEIRKDLTYSFITNSEHRWKHCRPVRRDEVTFYEDKKE